MATFLHRGDERIWSRLILTVATIPVTAMFASMHGPFSGWTRHEALRLIRSDAE